MIVDASNSFEGHKKMQEISIIYSILSTKVHLSLALNSEDGLVYTFSTEWIALM